ncbi:MAG: suppressor of fused domain protein [Verrucomicrobiaceae bacterium]|nr:MAG: suppressor of fused domain protein [Verrucomicrobiaceae bacterium]
MSAPNRPTDPEDQPPELSPSGAPIFRHSTPGHDPDLVAGDNETIDVITRHLEKHLGPVETVFHEIISPLVHIDVHVLRPYGERDCTVLVTSGMSDREMTVPEELHDFRFMELMLCLPADWPLDQKSFEDERNYWPVRWLKMMARFPHEYQTWLGYGHTVPNGDPPKPFASNTEFSSMVVFPPVNAPEDFHLLQHDDKLIRFFQIVPLYREELTLKLNKGLDALIERLDEFGIGDVIDIQRPNVVTGVARKKPWWKRLLE